MAEFSTTFACARSSSSSSASVLSEGVQRRCSAAFFLTTHRAELLHLLPAHTQLGSLLGQLLQVITQLLVALPEHTPQKLMSSQRDVERF